LIEPSILWDIIYTSSVNKDNTKEMNCSLIEPSILWDIIYTISVNKDDTTAAMIGAGVYLVFIIVFFSIAIAIFYYFISYWVYGSNCNTIRIILSVWSVYWPVRVLDVLHQKGSEINNLAVCDIVVNQRNNSLR
jgi:hypothetical protein